MSTLIVKSVKVDEVKKHPNADKLDLAIIGGWQVVVSKDTVRVGDIGVYIPPDSLVPAEFSDHYGFTKYLKSNGRVCSARLRGEPSHGVFIKNDDFLGIKDVGEDLAERFGITKYVSERITAADAEVDHPKFDKYTEIENIRHFSTVFELGEEVVITEKLHGTNTRTGFIDGLFMSGSHKLRRKLDDKKTAEGEYDFEHIKNNPYLHPFSISNVRNLLQSLGKDCILYGEVCGKNVQGYFSYGVDSGFLFRAFDLKVNGNYLDYDEFSGICSKFDVPIVPVLYRGPFSMDKVKELSVGKSTYAEHIREGVVIKPVKERADPAIGRVVLKYISDDFLLH